MTELSERERLRHLFRFFADTQCRGRSAVYEALSHGVARDDALLDLLMRTPDDQRRPTLLLAAVNLLLAAHPDAALAAYYPIHGGRRAPDDQLVSVFAEFCAEHAAELGTLLRTRATQTNEIRRCAALRLALGEVTRRWPGPLALVEVGASAGLNLLFDRYDYRIGEQVVASAASPVLVACELRGDSIEWPVAVPEITSRLGIDRQPIDLTDADQRAWLQAFIWPEDTDGLATLRGAIDLAVTTGTAHVVSGDATTDTARRLATLPGGEPVVVFTASLLSYLDAEARRAFLGQLDDAARQRPVVWVFAEAPGLLADVGLPAPTGPLARRNIAYAVGVSFRGPDRHDRVLAMADPYVRWLAPARRPDDDFAWLPVGSHSAN